MPDLTTAEMRERAEELRKLMQQYRGDIDRFSCVLDLALEALARREREEAPNTARLRMQERIQVIREKLEPIASNWTNNPRGMAYDALALLKELERSIPE
jgi:hypothetical protein